MSVLSEAIMKNVKDDGEYKLGDEIGTIYKESLVSYHLLPLEPKDELPICKHN
jgi:hypothetical protein